MHKLKLMTKIADQSWELEEISRLNHQTFAEEISQHNPTENGLLTDKFHLANQYIICLNGQEIAGMIALRDVRPFSLDSTLSNIDDYLILSNGEFVERLTNQAIVYNLNFIEYKSLFHSFLLLLLDAIKLVFTWI